MTNQRPNKGLNISLWIAQGLLAAMFLMSGFNKLSQPIDQLVAMLPWVTDVPESLVRFIGLCEVAGSLGILLPSILRIKPMLTPLAAIGLTVIMGLAAGFHASRGEHFLIGINLAFMAMALFVAWGRSKKAPVQARKYSHVNAG